MCVSGRGMNFESVLLMLSLGEYPLFNDIIVVYALLFSCVIM